MSTAHSAADIAEATRIRADVPALMATENARRRAAAPAVEHVHSVSLLLEGVIVGPAGSVSAEVAAALADIFREDGWSGCVVADEGAGARLKTTR